MPRNPPGGAARLIFGALGRQWRSLVPGLVFSILVVAFRVALPWPLRGVVELVFPEASGVAAGSLHAWLNQWGDPIAVLCGAYLALSILVGACVLVQRRLMSRSAGGVVRELRDRALVTQGQSPVADKRVDLVTRLVGDANRLKTDLRGMLVHLSHDLLLMLAVTVLFLWLSPRLGIAYLSAGVLAAAIGYRGVSEVASTARQQRSREARFARRVERGVQQASSEVPGDQEGAGGASDGEDAKDRSAGFLIEQAAFGVQSIVAAIIALALYFGVQQVREGLLGPGELFLFIAYTITMQRRASRVGRQVAKAGRLLATTERLAAASPEEPSLAPPADTMGVRQLCTARRRRGGKRRISLKVAVGSRVVLLGGQGAGKTRVLRCLAGLTSASVGRLYWDGARVRRRHGVLASVEWLAEEPRPLAGPLWLALGLADGEDPAPDVWKQLKRTGVKALVRRLSAGLNKVVEARSLSAGERRAVCLARVLLSSRPIWILDRPVSGNRKLDRRLVRQVIERAAGRTLVMALNRPCEVEQFDRVVVMAKGRVRFDGSPREWLDWSVSGVPEVAVSGGPAHEEEGVQPGPGGD